MDSQIKLYQFLRERGLIKNLIPEYEEEIATEAKAIRHRQEFLKWRDEEIPPEDKERFVVMFGDG